MRRHRLLLGWFTLVAMGVAFGFEWLALQRDARWNAAIEEPPLVSAIDYPGARGALADAVQKQLDRDLGGALERYSGIPLDADDPLAMTRRYNLGLIWLAQATEQERAGEPELGVPLIELAKQAWRDVLRAEPDNYDARYNLAQALQMLPELDRLAADEEIMPERSPIAPQATRAIDRLP